MKRIYISLFILAGLFSGCSDDFLDVDQTDKIPVDVEYLNTDSKAAELVTSIYNQFLSWDMSSFGWNGVTSIISDDADKGSDPGDTGADKDVL